MKGTPIWVPGLPAGTAGQIYIADPTAGQQVRAGRSTFLAQPDPGLGGGILGWNFDPVAIGASQIMTAATLYLAKIPVPAQMSVTNVLAFLSVNGATLTHAYAALYKSDGTKIGQSADQSSVWNTGAVKLTTTALSGGPFTVTPLAADDFVWAALYVGTATTPPTFYRTAVNNAAFNISLSVSLSRWAQQAVADTANLPSITPSSNTASSNTFWMGIS
jgi:hypothetical protein